MRFNIGRKRGGEREETPAPFESFDQSFVQPQGQAIPQQSVDMIAGRVDMLDSSVTAIRGWVEDARNRITALENTMNDTVVPLKGEIAGIRKDVGSMNEKLQQLMALYEVISTQYNPFIETSATHPPAEEASKEEREIEQLLRSVSPDEFYPAPNESIIEVPESYESGSEPEFAELAPIPEEEFGLGFEEAYEPEERGALNRMPDTYSSNAFTIKLLEFLISKVGRKNLPDLLEYYESIGWIGKDARRHLLEIASGVSVKEGTATDWKLNPEDNLKALQFIQEIKGRPVKKSDLDEIERKVEKIKGL